MSRIGPHGGIAGEIRTADIARALDRGFAVVEEYQRTQVLRTVPARDRVEVPARSTTSTPRKGKRHGLLARLVRRG